jgi:hypothetical protein
MHFITLKYSLLCIISHFTHIIIIIIIIIISTVVIVVIVGITIINNNIIIIIIIIAFSLLHPILPTYFVLVFRSACLPIIIDSHHLMGQCVMWDGGLVQT